MTTRRSRNPAQPSAPLSRRRFVGLVAAGSAALLAAPALAAPAHRHGGKSATKSARPAETAGAGNPNQKEFERQRTGTLGTLKTLRALPLPPGGDLPVVFRPLRGQKRGR